MPDDDDILEITWDDLRDVPATPAADLFSAVDPADAALAGGREPWIDLDAVCARTRGSFTVRFRQTGPGVYAFVSLVGGAAGKPSIPSAAGRNLAQVQASFNLAGYTGCPHCGMPELIQCDRCGTIACGGAVQRNKHGAWVICPGCGGRGQVVDNVQLTVQGQVGGMKGKPGDKRW